MLSNSAITLHRWLDKPVFTYPRKHCGFGKQGPYTEKLSQNTGICFQRCVGFYAINTLNSITFESDKAHPTTYHQRFLHFLKIV